MVRGCFGIWCVCRLWARFDGGVWFGLKESARLRGVCSGLVDRVGLKANWLRTVLIDAEIWCMMFIINVTQCGQEWQGRWLCFFK